MSGGVAAREREVTAPRRILSTDSAGRALVVVDELIGEAATRGERAGNLTRLLVASIGSLVWGVSRWPDLGTDRAAQIVLGAGLSGVVIGLWFLQRMRRPATKRLVIASALLDAVLVCMILVGIHAFHTEGFEGIPRLAGTYLFTTAITGSSLRLSRRAVVASAAAHGVVLFVIFLHSAIEGGYHPHYLTDWAIVFIVWLGAALLAFASASRTRRLVLAGATKTLEAERSRQLLGAYVSEEVAAATMESEDLRLGGEDANVAVLFSDLRGFTTLSETLPPDELVRQLNRYLSVMVEAIRSHGGVVDKYIGDAIMAVFGAPRSRPDDAARAIRAAQTMQLALAGHNRDREKRGLPPLRQGIGVHFGPVVAGNIGTPDRANYTVIGDTVNTASRLESATKELDASILVSDAARLAAERSPGDLSLPELKPAGEISVRGREAPVAVFTVATG